jgi:endonuclease V-like protein UPF0215 family
LYRIKEVKPEIRALGISVKETRDGRFLIIGVVFRGNRHLDGVLKTLSEGSDVTGRIVEMIQGSSHIHQLRVILLDLTLLATRVILNPYLLSRMVVKPVIVLGYSEQTHENVENAFSFNHWPGGGDAALTIGVYPKKAQKIIETTSKTGLKPEALRIAEILALSVTESIQHNL